MLGVDYEYTNLDVAVLVALESFLGKKPDFNILLAPCFEGVVLIVVVVKSVEAYPLLRVFAELTRTYVTRRVPMQELKIVINIQVFMITAINVHTNVLVPKRSTNI